MREAPDRASHQRRLAIWLTHVGRLAAHQVGEFLCAFKQAVWLWIAQYNQRGPEGLQRQGRVSPLDGQLFSLVLPWVDAQAVSIFLAHGAAHFRKEHCLMLGAG